MTCATDRGNLAGRRALITSADIYMGPAITERFRADGVRVIADTNDYRKDPEFPARIVADALPLDILVVNLIPTALASEPAHRQSDTEWNLAFEAMVHPTMRFVRAVLPGMIERRRGKIIVVTSTAPLQPRPNRAAYTAARGAQNAYVRAVGVEVAGHNVQVNAIAQSYVYGGFKENFLEDPANREVVLREVPAQRLAEGWEQAALVRFLASDESNYFSGQVLSFSGGRVTHS
ncbi:MAG: SDR family oxidoreductase [Pseudomonadota bacterium]|nr:SDR family oxidoreductase [Pseudomonadota bacterium]